MSTLASTTNLGGATATFDQMIQRFGVVTVMNAKVFTQPLANLVGKTTLQEVAALKVHDIVNELKKASSYVVIDSLKIANINMEGPDKTVTGGQYANPLIKFGKSATIEMQDALGNTKALEAFGICVNETFTGEDFTEGDNQKAVHFTEDFAGPVTILGDSFFIDQRTGQQVPVQILLYQVLPDSIMNLTQDSEGDATVFDLNGSLLTTTITVGDKQGNDLRKGVFYSIIPAEKPVKGNVYTVTYKAAEGEEKKVDSLVLDQLNARFGTTQPGGQYVVPTVDGYTINKTTKDGGGVVVQGGTETLIKATTYELKKTV